MRIPLFPEEKRPLVFAHRGLSSEAPENTLASFAAARDAGIPGIELDIHITTDGKLVVIHDDDVSRTCRRADGGPVFLAVEESSWAELSALDAGIWKGTRFAGERILQLSELFEELGDAVYYDIELKSRSAADSGLAAAAARAIADSGLAGRCAVSSFNPMALRRFKRLSPKVPTAIIWSRSEELPPYLRHGEGRWIGGVDYIKPQGILIRNGSPLAGFARPRVAWTVDETGEAKRLVSLGCAGIVSNRPHLLGI